MRGERPVVVVAREHCRRRLHWSVPNLGTPGPGTPETVQPNRQGRHLSGLFARGEHPDGPGACLMERCDLLIRGATGGRRSAHPPELDRVVALLGRRANDSLDQPDRDRIMAAMLPRVLRCNVTGDHVVQRRLSDAAVNGAGLGYDADPLPVLLGHGQFTLAVAAATRGVPPGGLVEALDGAIAGYEKQLAEEGLLGVHPPLVAAEDIERFLAASGRRRSARASGGGA